MADRAGYEFILADVVEFNIIISNTGYSGCLVHSYLVYCGCVCESEVVCSSRVAETGRGSQTSTLFQPPEP